MEDMPFVAKPLNRYYATGDQQEKEDACIYCLSPEHCHFSCPEPQRQANPWRPDQDRSNRPASALHESILCCNCYQPGHAVCQLSFLITDDLWSSEADRQQFMDYWHEQVFSLEGYAEGCSPTDSNIAALPQIEEEGEETLMRFSADPVALSGGHGDYSNHSNQESQKLQGFLWIETQSK